MNVLLPAKFEVSSIILMSFRQGVILLPPPPQKKTPLKTTQNKPIKSPSRLGIDILFQYTYFREYFSMAAYAFRKHTSVRSIIIRSLQWLLCNSTKAWSGLVIVF